MGIAVEPIPPYDPPQEPCIDSDCYYAGGEYLTWWDTAPPFPPLPPIEEPIVPRPTPPDEPEVWGRWNIPEYPGTFPSPPPSNVAPTPSTPPPETPSPEEPILPPSSLDPLYAVIGGLLSQRPQVQARETPVVLVPQGATSPVLPLLLVILGVGGVVAYAYLRRK